MSYEQLFEKIKDLPEECLDKISLYVDSLKGLTGQNKSSCFEEICKLRETMQLDGEIVTKLRENSMI